MTAERPRVLFVCVHNAGRSQMAAGFLQHLAGGRVEVPSAGSQPADEDAAVPKHSASARCDHEYFAVMLVWHQQYPSDFVCGTQALTARNALGLAAMSKSRVAIIGIAWGGRET